MVASRASHRRHRSQIGQTPEVGEPVIEDGREHIEGKASDKASALLAATNDLLDALSAFRTLDREDLPPELTQQVSTLAGNLKDGLQPEPVRSA